MIVISPACNNGHAAFQSSIVSKIVQTIGTEQYNQTCLDTFAQLFEVQSWVLFQYDRRNSINNIASATSSDYNHAVDYAIRRFLARDYTVDPSLATMKSQPQKSACVIKIDVQDIDDQEYRSNFKQTHIQERLSFFHDAGCNLYQLNVFSKYGKRPFSPAEMNKFAGLAGFVIATAIKHEMIKKLTAGAPHQLELEEVEELLRRSSGNLSAREIQVCARVIAGMTIDRTARDLTIKRTSVVTYRQRAYEKLNISRQHELVALLNNMRFKAGSGIEAA